MNIVILGAGTVGNSIAELLCNSRQNVSLVDKSADALQRAEEQLDVRTVCGSAYDVVTLFQAGVQSADLCLAVTSLDEVNLMAASIAREMGAARSVARITNPAIHDTSTFDYRRHFRIDRLLSLEHLTALELAKQVRDRGLFTVENFARGGIEVREVEAQSDSQVIGIPLRELRLPLGVRVGVISNATRTVIAGADDVISAGDHVTLIGTSDGVESIKKQFEHRLPPRLKVIIAGGGKIGYHVAALLERRRFQVTLMESDRDRCDQIATGLDKATVLHADATRRSEMEEARVGHADVFIACTGRDEDNIICGVEARELGARRIMCVIRRPDYANVLEKLGIDVAVSPRQVLARQVVGLVEEGPIIDRSLISGQEAEVWEIEVAVDSPISRAALRNVEFKHGLVAAFERDAHVRVPGPDDQLKAGDTAIVLVDRSRARETLELFLPPKS